MINRALLPAIAACFVVAACSQKSTEAPKPQSSAVVPLPPEAPKPPAASANQDAKPAGKGNGRKGCGHGNCKVDIVVNMSATPCAKVTPENLDVFKGNKHDGIKWSISTTGWKFAANGIEFKDAKQKQFSEGGGHNTNTFRWKDANDDEETYKYSIHVTDGAKKCDVDPSVVNGADDEQMP